MQVPSQRALLATALLALAALIVILSSRVKTARRPSPREWSLLLDRLSTRGLKLLAVGTSNILCSTWVDQLARELKVLGYDTDDGVGDVSEVSARCDDAQELVVRTRRLGRPGWYSWGFAFDDCPGFVTLSGIPTKCGDGWRCARDEASLRVGPTNISSLAQGVDVILLSVWQNDAWARHACFNSTVHYEVLTVAAIRKLVEDVGRLNPRAFFLVMARYPYAFGARVASSSWQENSYVRLGLAALRNVIFVDFDFPINIDFYFQDISGHPNCRGGRLMALSALKALADAGLVSTHVPRGAPLDALYLHSNCSLPVELCRWSPVCFVAKGKCLPYSPGKAPASAGS